MENWEKGKFEQQWNDALKGAEGEVSPSIWNNIDLALTQAEGGDIRKRLVFYQRLAAASVIFALLVGGSSLYFNDFFHSATEQSSLSTTTQAELPTANKPFSPENNNLSLADSEKSETVANPDEKVIFNHPTAKSKDKFTTQEKSTASTIAISTVGSVVVINNMEVIGRENVSRPSGTERIRAQYYSSLGLNIPEPEANVKGYPREVTLWRRLPAFPASYMNDSKKKNTSNENLWASVGASAGSYNPNFTNSGIAAVSVPNTASGFSSTGYSESSNQGSAYSVGFSMGTKIAKRWVIQGGVNYLNQATDYQSNLISADASNRYKAFVADYRSTSTAGLQVTSPYEVNSISELVSIPVQAGYLIVDRKFGVQLNTGVATDLFMRNTLVDEAGQVSKFTESAGSDSPYRTVSWSGLLGSEFSYKLADHYRISLVPGLRYSFNSVLKSQSGSISNPIVMDVGFRFRYIFK